MENNKLKTLRYYDIFILTLILFGYAIYNSTIQYTALSNNTATLGDNVSFSSIDNYRALGIQSFLLFLAFIYLLLRKFDFSIFYKKIHFTPLVILQAIFLFIICAVIMDIHYIVSYNLSVATPSVYQIFPSFDISLILYSILNGFYEEIFFLGICLCVKEQHMKIAFLYSLIVRFSFHTYQGMGTAIALGLVVGTVFYIFYRKFKPQNLLPFFIAHTIADIIGLSVIFYFWK